MSEESTTFDFKVVTPEAAVLDEKAIFLKVPGPNGEIGVLSNHSPALIQLKAGEIQIQTDPKSNQWYFVPGGTIEVTPDHCTLLTAYLEKAEKIDLSRAQKSMERAIKRLTHTEDDVDKTRAEKSLARAKARVAIVERVSNNT